MPPRSSIRPQESDPDNLREGGGKGIERAFGSHFLCPGEGILSHKSAQKRIRHNLYFDMMGPRQVPTFLHAVVAL
jgi:hypothetical protein